MRFLIFFPASKLASLLFNFHFLIESPNEFHQNFNSEVFLAGGTPGNLGPMSKFKSYFLFFFQPQNLRMSFAHKSSHVSESKITSYGLILICFQENRVDPKKWTSIYFRDLIHTFQNRVSPFDFDMFSTREFQS
ncbi:MAG: hypothetical protein A2X09_14210 [Bacteroidetes bacterium GWF2_43_11]|nr:MAG: hypothetical protein A2X09_14210 [Bacteroidetes bacterium GWF2_43_11]